MSTKLAKLYNVQAKLMEELNELQGFLGCFHSVAMLRRLDEREDLLISLLRLVEDNIQTELNILDNIDNLAGIGGKGGRIHFYVKAEVDTNVGEIEYDGGFFGDLSQDRTQWSRSKQARLHGGHKCLKKWKRSGRYARRMTNRIDKYAC
jgi:hypothetical protein